MTVTIGEKSSDCLSSGIFDWIITSLKSGQTFVLIQNRITYIVLFIGYVVDYTIVFISAKDKNSSGYT